MPENSDKLKSLYDHLKSNPAITGIPDDYEKFQSTLSGDPKRREAFYNSLKGNDRITGLPDYDTFNTKLFSANEAPEPELENGVAYGVEGYWGDDEAGVESEEETHKRERNPLYSLGKTMWNVVSKQMRAGLQGTHAVLAEAGGSGLSSDPMDSRAMRFRKSSEDALKNIKEEEKAAAREGVIKAFKSGQLKMDKFEENMEGVTNKISEVNDTVDFLNYLGSVTGQAIAQIPAAAFSFGMSSIGQEIGHNYIEQVEKVSRREGIEPEEVIKRGMDNKAAATAWGTLAGSLDLVGARGVMQAIPYKTFIKDLGRRAINMFGAMKREMYTEGTQGVISQFGSSQGAGDSIVKSFKDIDPEAVAEEALAGFFGAGGVHVGSQALSRDNYVEMTEGDKAITKEADQILKDIEAETEQQLGQEENQPGKQGIDSQQEVQFRYDPEATPEEQATQLASEKVRLKVIRDSEAKHEGGGRSADVDNAIAQIDMLLEGLDMSGAKPNEQEAQKQATKPSNALDIPITNEEDVNELQQARDELQDEMEMLEDNEMSAEDMHPYRQTLDYLDQKIQGLRQPEEGQQADSEVSLEEGDQLQMTRTKTDGSKQVEKFRIVGFNGDKVTIETEAGHTQEVDREDTIGRIKDGRLIHAPKESPKQEAKAQPAKPKEQPVKRKKRNTLTKEEKKDLQEKYDIEIEDNVGDMLPEVTPNKSGDEALIKAEAAKKEINTLLEKEAPSEADKQQSPKETPEDKEGVAERKRLYKERQKRIDEGEDITDVDATLYEMGRIDANELDPGSKMESYARKAQIGNRLKTLRARREFTKDEGEQKYLDGLIGELESREGQIGTNGKQEQNEKPQQPEGKQEADPIEEMERELEQKEQAVASFMEKNNETSFQVPFNNGSLTVTRTPGKKQWQLTSIDSDGKPSGDTKFDTYEEAVKAVTFEWGADISQATVSQSRQAQSQEQQPKAFITKDKKHKVERDKEGKVHVKKKDGTPLSRRSKNFNKVLAEYVNEQERSDEQMVDRFDYYDEKEYYEAVAEESNDPVQIAEAYEEAKQSENRRVKDEEETPLQAFIRNYFTGGKKLSGVIERADMEHYIGKGEVRDAIKHDPRLNFLFTKKASSDLASLTQIYNDDNPHNQVEPQDVIEAIMEEVERRGEQNELPDKLAEAFHDKTGHNLTDRLAGEISSRASEKRQAEEANRKQDPEAENVDDDADFDFQQQQEAENAVYADDDFDFQGEEEAPFQQKSQQRGKNPTPVETVTKRVRKAFPNLAIHEDQKSFDEAYKKSKKYNPDNEPAALLSGGEVYINPRKAGPDTPIHEIGEVWMRAAEDNYPEFVQKGKELVEGTEYDTRAKELYPDESRDTQLKEALLEAIADHGANTMLFEYNHPMRTWIKNLWRKIKAMLGIRPTVDLGAMTLSDMSALVSEEIISGIAVTTADGQKVSITARGEKGRGVQFNNGLLVSRDFKYDKFKRFMKTQFRSHMGVGTFVSEQWDFWKGQIKYHHYQAFANGVEVKRAIRREYGSKPSADVLATLNDALNDVTRIADLPEQLRIPMYNMRAHIDALSAMLIKSGLVEDDLISKITDNLGVYVHRSFRAHDDAKWTLENLEKDPDKRALLNTARYNLRQEMKAQYNKLKERAAKLIERNQNLEIESLRIRIAKLKARGQKTRAQALKKTLDKLQEREFDDEARELLEQAERFKDPTTAHVNRILDRYLEGYKNNSESRAKTGSNIAQKDLDVLKKRKKLPEWLLDVLGEHRDPITNYLKSVQKMTSAVENHKFLTSLAEQGRGTYFFREDEDEFSRRYNAKISMENNPMLEPLDGMSTTPEIKEALERDIDPQYHVPILRLAIAINGMAKYNKTILSLMTQIRNFSGNISMVMATGHLNFKASYIDNSIQTVKAAIKARHSASLKGISVMKNGQFIQLKPNEMTKKEWAALQKYFEYARMNIIDENPISGEMKDLIEDISAQEQTGFDTLIDSYTTWMSKPVKKSRNVGSKIYSTLAKVYQSGDDFFKIMLYEMELDRYKAVYKNDRSMIREDGSFTEKYKRKMAHIVRKTLPTYSLVPKAANTVRKFAFLGSFVSFNVALTQATFHNAQMANQELRSNNPELRKIGAKRLAGLISMGSLPYALELASISMGSYLGYQAGTTALSAISRALGDDEEEDKREFAITRRELNALKMLSAPWVENSNIIYLGKEGNGDHTYIDISYSVPHALYGRAVNAIMRRQGDDLLEETMAKGAYEGVLEWLDPALSEEIGFRHFREAFLSNEEVNVAEGVWKRTGDRLAHFWTGIEPGVVTRGKQITQGLSGIKDRDGREVSALDPMLKMTTGVNVSKINPGRSLFFKMKDLSTLLTQSSYIYSEYSSDKQNYDEETLDAKYREANEAIEKHLGDYRRYINAARTLGIDEGTIVTKVKAARVSNQARRYLLKGGSYKIKKRH